jgi:hypothetical protein
LHPGIEFPVIGAVNPEFINGDEKLILDFITVKPLLQDPIVPIILFPITITKIHIISYYRNNIIGINGIQAYNL